MLFFVLFPLLAVTQVESYAHFFGPVAVGFGVGLVSVHREFPVATSIVSRRSSRQYSLSTFYQSTPYASFGYSTRSYSESDHFYTANNLAYYQPNMYHYHSTPWGHRFGPGRKKRAAERARVRREAPVDLDNLDVNQIGDVAANISAGYNSEVWYNDMSYKDRDDCSKRLLCELNAKYAAGQHMEEDETAIALSFGKGAEVDIGEETMDFDIAAVVGQKIGQHMCERRYRRCETPVSRMLDMIRLEMSQFSKVEEELNTGAATLDDIENALEDETEELATLSEKELFQTTTETPTTKYYPGFVKVWGGRI